MGGIGKLFMIGLLACGLSLAGSAQETSLSAEPTTGAAETLAPGQGSTAPAEGETAPERPVQLEGFPGLIQQVTAVGILVQGLGQPSDPTAPAFMFFRGQIGVPVKGEGRKGWLALRRGDVVLVSYEKGPPHMATQVNVLPKSPGSQARRGTKRKPSSRTFIGYVKKKEGDELIVMPPRRPVQGAPRPEVKAFTRREDTRVAVLRESWDEVRKGDRVRILHQKGNPRPIDLLQVIRLGGEEPMLPGVATRLFDPRYDESVKDVDGIGETGPVPELPKGRPGGDGIRVKRRRPDK